MFLLLPNDRGKHLMSNLHFYQDFYALGSMKAFNQLINYLINLIMSLVGCSAYVYDDRAEVHKRA